MRRSADILVGGSRASCSHLALRIGTGRMPVNRRQGCLRSNQMKLRMPEMPPATLLAALGSYNLLPAIVFLPTRRRCDEAASEAALSRRTADDDRREARRDFMRSFVEEHPEIRKHRHWDTIIRGGIASHHAGHMPAWKLVIEKMMSAGLLDTIFATATVAAGVDFPARTVVVTVADRRSARGWQTLTASELQQMTGRAGRRGKDRVGFIVAAPGPHQNPQRIAELLSAPPNDLESQFRATYTSLLNLLDAFGSFAQVRAIAERSFAHRNLLPRIHELKLQREESETRIRGRLERSSINLPIETVLGLERLASARSRLLESAPHTRREMRQRWLNKVVQPGRVVAIGRSGKRLVLVIARTADGVTALREDGRFASFPLQRVGRVFAPTFSTRPEKSESAFDEIHDRGDELALPEPRLRDAQAGEEESIKLINDAIDSLAPAQLADAGRDAIVQTLWSLQAEAATIEKTNRQVEGLRSEIWEPFERCARVLAHFGYLDFASENVTDRGKWLADLRVDRPLLIGEALQRNLFASLDTTRAAALIAALAADEDRDYGELELDDAIVSLLVQFEEISFEVSTEEWKQGIEAAPEINFSAAAAAAHWAGGADWPSLVHETRAEEGDLVRLLSRTGEALLQIAGLRGTHSQAALLAARAAEIVLREPVR
jgi:ATP-dependent RNA helicase HelY